jgi:hypothetical protein
MGLPTLREYATWVVASLPAAVVVTLWVDPWKSGSDINPMETAAQMTALSALVLGAFWSLVLRATPAPSNRAEAVLAPVLVAIPVAILFCVLSLIVRLLVGTDSSMGAIALGIARSGLFSFLSVVMFMMARLFRNILFPQSTLPSAKE